MFNLPTYKTLTRCRPSFIAGPAARAAQRGYNVIRTTRQAGRGGMGNRVTLVLCILALLRLTALKRLTLTSTAVTDKGALQLQALRNLESLSLGGTKVTDDGIAALRNAMPQTAMSR